MEEEIVCNRWRDLAGDSFLSFLFARAERKEEIVWGEDY